jgi:uncharacterized protein YkwD
MPLVLLLALLLWTGPLDGPRQDHNQAQLQAATPLLEVTAPPTDGPERKMFEQLNAAREQSGLSRLAWSPELARAAAAHSGDMARNGFLDHDGSDGSEPWQRALRQGYLIPSNNAWMVIEAISAMPGLDGALGWLMQDGLHRRVLMRPSWREFVIGYVQGGPYGNYWTLDFGCRPNILPAFASPTADGTSVTLAFTSELCNPAGGGPSEMGRPVELQVATSADIADCSWEPWVDSKSVPRPSSQQLYVRHRDATGRLSTPQRLALPPSAAASLLQR